MTPSSLLSKIDSPFEVRRYLGWHVEQRVPLRLMFGLNEGHFPAYVVGFDEAAGTMDAVCMGVPDIQSNAAVSYAAIGSTASGARFLASGQISADAADRDSFKLSLPRWLDVSQSRDCYRCEAPAGHFLHFSSPDPHLNDIICKVKNVSLGGLAVEWEPHAGTPSFSEGSQSDDAVLQVRERPIHLGKLRVAHMTHEASRCAIGLTFDRGAPQEFGSLVLAIQRAHHLVTINHD